MDGGDGGDCGAAPSPPRAYPASIASLARAPFAGAKGAGRFRSPWPAPPRASPCGLASLARVPLTLKRRGTVDSCLRRNDGCGGAGMTGEGDGRMFGGLVGWLLGGR